MRRLFAILVGVLVLLGVVYLASVNPTHVDFHYGPVHRLEQVHVVTLLVGAVRRGRGVVYAPASLQVAVGGAETPPPGAAQPGIRLSCSGLET